MKHVRKLKQQELSPDVIFGETLRKLESHEYTT